MSDPETPIQTPKMLDMILSKFGGDASHLVMFEVPDAVGTSGRRFCDAIAVGNWKSSGRLIHGFEVKVSRADWLRELKQVDKADPFIRNCDRWWLVTASKDIVKDGELPYCWGWMYATPTGLRIAKPAPVLPQPEGTMNKLFALALIRRAMERGTLGFEQNPDIQAQFRKLREDYERRLEERVNRADSVIASKLKQLEDRLATFERASGINIDGWDMGNVGRQVKALRQIGYDGLDQAKKTLEHHRDALIGVAANIDTALKDL